VFKSTPDKTKRKEWKMLLLTKKRKAMGLSQAALARKADMHNSSVNCIENGHMKPWPGQREKLEVAMKAAGWDGEDDLFSEVES
jgi:ribosome-binding protein aMBF1 (putative translation factor)